MHRSRLGALVIDCQSDDFDRDIAFWGAALGGTGKRDTTPGDEHYARVVQDDPDEVQIILQKVDHPSRVHLDIEADDIEAEVVRLEKLGARRVAQIKGWWVMEAPSGHRFCVVPPQRADFESGARTWD